MALFGRNWLEEGYYEEDEQGNLNRIDEYDSNMFARKYRSGMYYHDGYSLNKINDMNEDLEIEP